MSYAILENHWTDYKVSSNRSWGTALSSGLEEHRRISDQLEKKQSNFAVLHDPRLGCPTAAAASTAIERKIPSWVDLEETMRDSPPRSVIWDINTERLPQRLSHSIGCLLAHGARWYTRRPPDQKHKMSSSHNGYSWPGHAERDININNHKQ